MITGGIGLALLASVASALAVVLQAAENRRAPLSRSGRVSLLVGLARRRRWLAGTGLMILAWPLQVIALTLAPITVVQPLLATSQLVLLAVARVRLGERVGRLEAAGALAIVSGVAVVVWSSPRHGGGHPDTLRVAQALLAVGLLAVLSYGLGRAPPRRALSMVIGAGLAYAWVDLADKLLADALAGRHWAAGALWLAAILGFGGLAFLQETTALQRRPAVTVVPVVGAVHDPLPVLMALWGGLAVWGPDQHRVAPLLLGLAVIAAGAALLGRSPAVAGLSDAHAALQPPERPVHRGPRPAPRHDQRRRRVARRAIARGATP